MRWIATGLLLLTLGMRSGIAAADLRQSFAFAIAPQGLNEALLRYAEQSGVQVTSASSLLDGKASPGVTGTFPARAALERLLLGTQLRYDVIDSNTVVIRPLRAGQGELRGSATTTQRPAGEQAGDPLRLAEASEETAVEGPVGSKPSSPAPATQIEEIVVTGTHISGQRDVATPTMQLTRESITNGGYTRVEDLMRDVPQNFAGFGQSTRLASGGSRVASSNTEQATSIDLRGLGPQSTLVLVNGQRRSPSVRGQVVDISSIPLAAIERVDIVTGGNSAIYGADAVGGVVNFLLRRSFEGSESNVEYGLREGRGGSHLHASEVAGYQSERSGAVVAYDYMDARPLDLLDTDRLISPSASGRVNSSFPLENGGLQHSFYLAGQTALTPDLSLHFDGLYSRRRNDGVTISHEPGIVLQTISQSTVSEQYSVSGGATLDLHPWRLDLAANEGRTRDRGVNASFLDFGPDGVFESADTALTRARISEVSLVANGPLPTVLDIAPRAALGVEYRRETNEYTDIEADTSTPFTARNVRAAFGEIDLPLLRNDSSRGVQLVQLSLAGRYDRYSDFGSAFSPDAGLVVKVSDDWTLRSSWSKAYRAPDLYTLSTAPFVFLFQRKDSLLSGGQTQTLEAQAGNPDLNPERARTFTAGFDWRLPWADTTKISVSYFDIHYDDRIISPAIGSDLVNILFHEDLFPGLVNRKPTQQQIEALVGASPIQNFSNKPFAGDAGDVLAAFPNIVLIDDRIQNVAREHVDGLDLAVASRIPLAGVALVSGINGTYSFSHTTQLTAAAPSVSRIDDIGKPVGLRWRAQVGVDGASWSTYAYWNYVGSYDNTLSTPASHMPSWSTLDLSARLAGSRFGTASWLRGLELVVSCHNVFDRSSPIYFDSPYGIGFDPANGSARGRDFVLSGRLKL